MSSPRSLTQKQLKVLEAIQALTAERGIAPTLEQIRDRVGIRSVSSVWVRISILRKAGYLLPHRPYEKSGVRLANGKCPTCGHPLDPPPDSAKDVVLRAHDLRLA